MQQDILGTIMRVPGISLNDLGAIGSNQVGGPCDLKAVAHPWQAGGRIWYSTNGAPYRKSKQHSFMAATSYLNGP